MAKRGTSGGPARVKSAALRGIEALEVAIEVDVLKGLPSFTLVGLGDTAVKESKERMISALSNIGYTPPRRKTIVSLAPASLKKEGSLYDLAIAIGFLMASDQARVLPQPIEDAWFIGELGLDGTVRPVRGVLPIVLAAMKRGVAKLYVPAGNRKEAEAVADRLAVYPVASLQELINHLTQSAEQIAPLTISSPGEDESLDIEPEVDFADIRGQEHAKRALLLSASGDHNVLLVGGPGTGKTLLARALAGILPPLTREESYVVTSLYSIAGLLTEEQSLLSQRPFRSPHHGASSVALVGGGAHPRPGEVSLAHGGVLFLDELPEFSRHVLDQLRQPIEDGVVTVARSSQTVRFPAHSILVGAMNPCKCGYLGSERKDCQCPPGDILRYQRRVSGPLLDRFDVHLMVNDVPAEELLTDRPSSASSRDLAQLVATARERQIIRQGKPNAQLTVREVKKYCQINDLTKKLLYQAEEHFHLSARGIHRLLKVARTIADLEAKESIEASHVAEALQYREQLKAALPDFV